MNQLTLWGGPVAKAIYDEVRASVADLVASGWQPRLLSIVIGDSTASAVYMNSQKKFAARCGIGFEVAELSAHVTRDEFLATLAAKNGDPRVTGIIIQRPVAGHLDLTEVQQAVHPLKDVEGMHPVSLGQVVYGEAHFAPCTAKAAVRLLMETGLEMAGLKVIVVGRSEIVGKPISLMLVQKGCTVTMCHSRTRNLASLTRQADAVFMAVGRPRMLTADMIRAGAAVIDVGINVDPLDKTSICGDVDYDNVWPVAGWTTPVPRGVGTVTTAMLMQNIVLAAQRQRRHYEAAFGPGHASTNIAMATQAPGNA